MALSDTARKNLAAADAEQESALRETDPEFCDLFFNFAFDQVPSHGKLDPKTRRIVILASLIALQGLGQYRAMLPGALDSGVTPVEVKEILYQSVSYAGMAKAYEFFQATNEILRSRGVTLPLPSQATTAPRDRAATGMALLGSVFGGAIDRMRERTPAGQMHLQDYISENCFGGYYTRSGLDIKTRELITFAMILSLGGCEPQLRAHIHANLNVGNDKQTLLEVATQLVPYLGYPRTLNAVACLNQVAPEE